MSGLLGADLAVVTSPASVVAPHAIDAVVAKIRAAHRHVFDSPPPPAPSATAPEQAQGSAAEAIRAAETSLALQNSTSAQLDLQVITAVLNAHTTDTAGRAALDGLQRDIENAVATRTDLDTPAGARAFQRYLIDRLRDIKTVVETAGLDATSKASLAAALASLYAATTPGSGDDAQPARTPPERPAATPEPQMPAGPGADPFLDTLPGADDLSAPPTAVPAGPPPTPAPMVAPVPPLPAAGGTVSPATLPSVPAGMPAAVDGPAPMRLPGNGDTDAFDGALLDEPLDEDDPAERDNEPDTAEEEPGPPPNTGPTVVDLPDGDTVTAPTPQLAAAITAAVAGTPVAEAFRQQGITIPAPGTAVAHPVEPAKTRPGDIGMLTDRHALALGHGKAVLDNRIQPIASVAGPSFLGWEHPPEPGSAPTTTPTPDQPAPTRPAVTAGPPAIGE
ncbi:DUF4226 domain-containing protein [Mycolicibacterium sp. CH28]|nr:DUF4226 domain-containing protein [Mycolicibacterium sp. CH28]